jgi:hypothetical protein
MSSDTKKKRRKHYRGRRQRIYYGRDKVTKKRLYHSVYVTPAKEPVRIKGSLLHALLGTPGETLGCHLSNCGWDNRSAFPHDVVYLPSFTRSTCLVADEIRDGKLYHAFLYEHDYAELVDLNDKDKGKVYIQEHPELVEREFILRVPQKRKPSKKVSGEHHDPTDPIPEKAHKIPRGALRRAVAAGMLPPGIEQALLDE